MNNRIKLGLVLAFGVVLTVLAANFVQDVANTTIRYRQGSKLTFDTSVIIADEDGAWSYTAKQAFGGGTNGGTYSANPSFNSVTVTNASGNSFFGGPLYFSTVTNSAAKFDSTGLLIAPTVATFGSSTNSLLLNDSYYTFPMTANVAITNVSFGTGNAKWATVGFSNSTASAVAVFITVPAIRASGTVSATANTNGLQVASGKIAFVSILYAGATNWANSVEP